MVFGSIPLAILKNLSYRFNLHLLTVNLLVIDEIYFEWSGIFPWGLYPTSLYVLSRT